VIPYRLVGFAMCCKRNLAGGFKVTKSALLRVRDPESTYHNVYHRFYK